MNRLLRPKLFNTINNLSKNARKFHNTPRNLTVVYTKNDEWINYGQSDEKNNIKIGLTKNATEQLGEIVYIDFPLDVEDVFEKDDDLVFIESVKATDSIKAPFNGIIKNVNKKLEDDMDIMNQDPESYLESWLITVDKLDT